MFLAPTLFASYTAVLNLTNNSVIMLPKHTLFVCFVLCSAFFLVPVSCCVFTSAWLTGKFYVTAPSTPLFFFFSLFLMSLIIFT